MKFESFLELLKLVVIGLAAYAVFFSWNYIQQLKAANEMLSQAISGQCEQVLIGQGFEVLKPQIEVEENGPITPDSENK